MARTIRVVFRSNGGFIMRRASEEEREQDNKLGEEIFEKWKADPGIRFICYYLSPGVGHHMILEVDDISKIDEMDRDMYSTKGLLLEKYSFEIVLGETEVDEWMGS
jgi:hypothetical protein